MFTVSKISYRYDLKRENYALKDVSFSTGDNRFVILSGSSGSGKTTLLYALSGLLKVESGSILVDGEDITKYDEKKAAAFRNEKLGFVFQNYFLDNSLSNLENVYLASLIGGKMKKKDYLWRATSLLLKVGITSEMFKRKPNQLSGGEQQRIGIARAMMNSPKIILADEPTGNLDSSNGKMIMDLLKELSLEEKMMVVVVTHEESYFHYADQIIRLADGMIKSDES